MERYLIIRTSALGDIIHALPAFAALRRHKPGAEIRWVTEPRGKEILAWVKGLDAVIVRGEPDWRSRLRGTDQTALDFQGRLKSGWIARASRARRRIGFHGTNLREPLARFFYTEQARPFSEDESVLRKNLHLLTVLGIEDDALAFPLEVPAVARAAARATLARLGWDGKRRPVLLNVGAAWPTKRWLPERWTAVLKELPLDKIFPVLLWGTDEEKTLADAAASGTAVPPAPFLSIPDAMALIAESDLLVSGDTFALQAAIALDVPVVGLFGPTSPRRNGPFRARDLVAYHEIECSRCHKRDCARLDCLKLIEPAEVTALIRRALEAHA